MTAPVPPVHPNCVCGCLIGFHAIRANKSRGACSTSNGEKAVPCGCKAFEAAPEPTDGLFPAPSQPHRGGPLL